ncbi:gamma-glutamylcyclotransferase family protein [Actomonas aquatica]|uniref:Gamma-glutamylcyclotransferase family protein n=1 Tax=Actomonas aquatica TaxID=2866162 RepID=A0ABZ1CCG4_9BACT|nr:gamma-glutamylcyclotransferase family protein [Opitutus sp. WL0086]WRQ89254.1 gamma-glutamylcyclotransferase family protein [Opitutus sp. WL0086]
MSKKTSSILLFAYDAHMDERTMTAVDEACEQMGLARADGQRLTFTAGGHPNLKPEDGSVAWGVLWVVPATAMVKLDAWAKERGLSRNVMMIICPAGPRIPATTYFAPTAPEGAPLVPELEAVIHGARLAKLDARYVAELEAFRKVSR